MYQIYLLRWNTSFTLNLISLGNEKKVKYYNKYFINGHVFYIEDYVQGRKTYNNEVCVKKTKFTTIKSQKRSIIQIQNYTKIAKLYILTC